MHGDCINNAKEIYISAPVSIFNFFASICIHRINICDRNIFVNLRSDISDYLDNEGSGC